MYPIEHESLEELREEYNRPEWSRVENYIAEESVEFCSEYIAKADGIGLPKNTCFESKTLSICKFFLFIFLSLSYYQCIFLFM